MPCSFLGKKNNENVEKSRFLLIKPLENKV